MLFFPLPSINIAAKPSPETPLVAGDFLAVGFVESTVMEQPDGGCHVTHTVAKTIQRSAGQNIQAHKRELHKLANSNGGSQAKAEGSFQLRALLRAHSLGELGEGGGGSPTKKSPPS